MRTLRSNKIEIEPSVRTLAQCRQMFGEELTVRTSGTCPSGATLQIGDDATLVNTSDKSEVWIAKTRRQLIGLGLLPSRDEDGVDEMAAYDVGSLAGSEGSDLSDCLAFEQMALASRGRASNEQMLTLESVPANSGISSSFFKAAGAEVLSVSYAGVQSAKRQIMNQADYFYYSGHGLHRWAYADEYTPNDVAGYWSRDLNCVIFAGCSILDINDYNNNFAADPVDHVASPGKLWESVGPQILLGYNYQAPQDGTGAPERIIRSWLTLRQSQGDADAWMMANDNRNGRNACAVVRNEKYVYFRKSRHKFYSTYEKVEVRKDCWND